MVVPFKIVYTRGTQANRLLQTGDSKDWFDYVTDTLQNDFGLLITDIAPDERFRNGFLLTREGVSSATSYPRDVAEQRYGSLRVLVYLPPDASYDEKRSRVARPAKGSNTRFQIQPWSAREKLRKGARSRTSDTFAFARS